MLDLFVRCGFFREPGKNGALCDNRKTFYKKTIYLYHLKDGIKFSVTKILYKTFNWFKHLEKRKSILLV